MQTVLNVFAAIALLVWGTHIVRNGVLRVGGGRLRAVLRRGLRHRSSAFFSGFGVTALLQSATATALLASTFAGQGLIRTSAALALMLGADVGSAMMTVVFSFDLSWLAPLAIVVGVVLYLSKKNEHAGQMGKVILGVGVIILALQMIQAGVAPLTDTAKHGWVQGSMRALLASISTDVLAAVLVGAILAALCWSSLAVVLLTASLAAAHLLPLPAALGLVLGANVGSGALAVLVTWRSDAVARRVPIGNLLFKVIGVALTLASLPLTLPWIGWLAHETNVPPMQTVVLFHLVFNVLIALSFVRLTRMAAQRIERWLPAPMVADLPGTPRHLDPLALNTPTLAIGNAAREAIRLADRVQDMLEGLIQVLRSDDFEHAERLRRDDDAIDRLYSAIKHYLAQISREALESHESRRWTEIIQFTINMEHVGDIIERTLADVAERKIQLGLSFSDEGMKEIMALHERLLVNLKLAVAVFLNGDLKSAQQLIAQKVHFRELEMKFADAHLRRLSNNTVQSL
ncbi:MAG TPA: Na/Pi cotransporter family protein, partial [Burkholderiaceae bacterium]|nr:Na/Pi cotransporter family protein [Burkholderiaceae bacterium]